jgi:hypothetical protein
MSLTMTLAESKVEVVLALRGDQFVPIVVPHVPPDGSPGGTKRGGEPSDGR